MLFSFKYLQRLANLPIKTNVEQVVEAFNNLGFEVENVEKFNKELKNLKFGKVIEVYKNPDENKLNVAKVLFNDKTRIIQTRANNVYKDMFVLAGIPGSTINDLKIDSKTIKGIKSEGMLTSLEEIGVSKQYIRKDFQDKITSFEEVDLSIDPIEHLDLDDWIIEIDILSNRADANSYLVMAKELAAYFNVKPQNFEMNKPTFFSNIKFLNEKQVNQLSVLEIKNNFNISTFEQILLAKSHFQSFDNVNDLANLVFIHSGQPTYFFSEAKVQENILVKLIDSEDEDNEKKLAFFSDNKFLSWVGDFNSLEKNIPNNQNVFFILSQFENIQVRNMVKKLKTFDPRSIQLTKKINQGSIKLALAYLSSYLTSFSHPVNWKPMSPKEITYDFSSLKKIIGIDLSKNQNLLEKLEKLDFVFKDKKVQIPFYRYDLFEQQDIDEEVLRIYGYDKIQPLQNTIIFSKVSNVLNLSEKIVSLNFNEVKTYTLTSQDKNIVNPFDFQEEKLLKTFVSNERRTIRKTQAISLLEIIEYHLKQKMEKLSFFSEGMIANEQKTYCLVSNQKSFNQIKQIAIDLLPGNIFFQRFSTKEKSVLINSSVKIMSKNKMIGWIGKVNPLLFNKNHLNDFFFFEFIKDKSVFSFSKKDFKNSPLKKRDITITLQDKEDLSSKWQDIECFNVEVIDIFYQDKIKKVTLRVSGNDEEIAKIDQKFNF